MRIFSLSMVACLTILVAGCSSPPPPQEPVQVVSAADIQNQQVVQALSQLAEIKEELKQLRNSVEELQFETENAKRRQQDFFQDLDRRLVTLERNERVLNAQTEDPLFGSEGGEFAVNDGVDPSIESGDNSDASEVQVAATDSTQSQGSAIDTATVVPSSESVTLAEQQAYESAFNLLKQSRYEDSITEFQALVDTWPNSQLADDSYYWMSEARYVNREFEYALSGFRTVVTRYPDSQRVPEALLKVGYIQYDIGAYEDAAETFRDILARFPGHQVTVAAQTRLRRIEQTIGG